MIRLLLLAAALLWLVFATALLATTSPRETERARIAVAERTLNFGGVQLSPDSRLITFLGRGGRAIHVWDLALGAEQFTLQTTGIADTVRFSPDSKWLATVDIEGNAQLWNARTGELALSLNGDVPRVEDVSFAPDSRRLAALGRRGETRLWDITRGEIIGRLDGNDRQSVNVLFSTGGDLLASASSERILHVWDLAAGEHRVWHRSDLVARVVLFTPDDRYVLTYGGPGFTRLWDTQTGDLIARVNYYGIYTAAIDRDGHVLMGGKRGGENQIHLFDLTTGEQRYTVGGAWAAFSPDARWLATASGRQYRDGVVWRGVGSYAPATEVWLWDVATRARWVIYRGRYHIERLWFSPDGRYVIFLDGGDVLRVLEIA